MRGRALLALAAALLPWMCLAQSPVGAHLLGLTEPELQALLPEAQHLRKPVVGPRGLRGLWEVPGVALHGAPFATTLYFRDRRMQRIEQLWTSQAETCDGQPLFAKLSTEMNLHYGLGMASNTAGDADDAPQSTVWTTDDVQMVAYYSPAPHPCTIRLVTQPLQRKDASEL